MNGAGGTALTAFVESVGWALLHLLWQGAVVAVGFAAMMAALRRVSANARYLAGCAALLALVVLPVATTSWLSTRPEERAVVAAPSGPASAPGMTASAAVWERPIGLSVRNPFRSFESEAARSPVARRAVEVGHRLEIWMPWIVRAWGLGVLLLAVRLLGGWVALRRWVRRWTRPLTSEWQSRADRLRESLGVRRAVRVLESLRESVPCALGVWRPLILLPAVAITGLSPSQLEAVIAHELAHIRRHDYLVNLLQSVVETLLFYHPAVWWISHRVRVERENCCDDCAVRAVGTATGYARALADLETMRGASAQLAVAASGGSLMARIRRILVPGTPQPLGSLAGPAGLIAAGCIAAFLLATQPPSKADETKPSAATPRAELVSGNSASPGVAREHPRRAPFPPGEGLDDVSTQDLLAGGDAMKRFALIGLDPVRPAPPDGYRLLVVLPGGDGGPDFHPFVKRIWRNALSDRYLVAQLVAPVWTAEQFDRIVWPTRLSPSSGMRFATEEFIEDVIREVRGRAPVDPKYVFCLGWSSGGPAVYAESLQEKKSVTGSFVAMSVFRPEQYPPVANARGHAYFLLYSPEDFIPVSMPERARDVLSANDAQVKTLTYEGGHGWHGDVYGNIAAGIQWLESTRNPFREQIRQGGKP